MIFRKNRLKQNFNKRPTLEITTKWYLRAVNFERQINTRKCNGFLLKVDDFGAVQTVH